MNRFPVLIAHRGNVEGICKERENTHDYISEAIAHGYDVEIDVWYKNGEFFLGHDRPETNVELSWLVERKDSLWVHAKNFDALDKLLKTDLRTFFHERERHTIINNCNLVWSHDLREAGEISIIPLLSMNDILNYQERLIKPWGICSDFVKYIRLRPHMRN